MDKLFSFDLIPYEQCTDCAIDLSNEMLTDFTFFLSWILQNPNINTLYKFGTQINQIDFKNLGNSLEIPNSVQIALGFDRLDQVQETRTK